MKSENIFEYSDIDFLLEKVPFDLYNDNDDERQAFIEHLFDEYNFYEIGKNYLTYDLDTISDNLDLHAELQYLYGCIDFYTTAFYYFSEKKNNKILNDYVNTTIRKIGDNLMKKIDAFCCLFIKEDYSDAISISRSIYELVLSSHLIYEYPQLAEPYRDKEVFLSIKFQKEFYGAFNDYSTKKMFYSLLDKYGDSLNENFGWTAKVFPDKEKRFHKNLANKLELQDVFKTCYQESCAYVHSAPYSLIHQELKECLIFSGWVFELLHKYCLDFFSLGFMNKKEKAIIKSISSNLIVRYINELTKFYTTEQRINKVQTSSM